jgi:phosphatidylserine/phosphatidylglycerophosphate/cardiolipin synthase-like enzyme
MMTLKSLLILLVFLGFQSFSFTQSIRAYFTQSVDNSISPLTDAQQSAHLDDTICKLIDEANFLLDLAVWDNGSDKIVTAINNAYNRGVSVRYISSTNSFNAALSGLNSNIPVLKRSSGLTSNVMHNKFIIVDNQKILTGSMNFGEGSIFDDYNNILILENVDLALTYLTEFNEMWGSTGALPNEQNSKFGPAKSDNTTHQFTIDETLVESYFSPTDNTTAKIVNAINQADYTLDIALFTFTNNDIGDAVIAAKNRGVIVRCIMENESYFGSEFSSLQAAGIQLFSHEDVPMDFHHKYCIADAQYPDSDPVVVTGSHNWTNSAEDEYDENTLIIHDVLLANQYLEEFSKRFQELSGTNSTLSSEVFIPRMYPNPSTGTFRVETSGSAITELQIVDCSGKLILEENEIFYNKEFSLDALKGVFFVHLKFADSQTVYKLIVH